LTSEPFECEVISWVGEIIILGVCTTAVEFDCCVWIGSGSGNAFSFNFSTG